MNFEFGKPFLKQKKLPGISGVLLAERLVRLFELETWLENNVVLLDLC